VTLLEQWTKKGCPKCGLGGQGRFTTRTCDEVNAQSCGPYIIVQCDYCHFEDYEKVRRTE